MDTNFSTISPDEKTELIKTNSCFYCRKPGHCATGYHKKARDRGMAPHPMLAPPTVQEEHVFVQLIQETSP